MLYFDFSNQGRAPSYDLISSFIYSSSAQHALVPFSLFSDILEQFNFLMSGGLCDLDYTKRMVAIFISLLSNNLALAGVR